jgi:hypothetical protein
MTKHRREDRGRHSRTDRHGGGTSDIREGRANVSVPAVQPLDTRDTMEREKALRVREAMLAWLRAFEDMHDLPRAVPTKVERGERDAKTGHHNR